MNVQELKLVAAKPEQAEGGLLGWVSFTLDDMLRADGIAIRRTRSGELTLSFPARDDRFGNRRHFIRPISDQARREIERQVFDQLQLGSQRKRSRG